MLQRVWRKGTLSHCWWEYKLTQPLRKTVWRFLKKLRIKLPYNPAIPLLGIYPEETKIEKDTCIPLFTAALCTIARAWKQPRCPWTDEWIEKLWQTCTMEYSVQFSCSIVSDSLQLHESQHARPRCPSPTPGVHSVHRVGDAIQPSHPLSSPSPPAPSPSQHQTLFQWVNSLHEVAKVLELQL